MAPTVTMIVVGIRSMPRMPGRPCSQSIMEVQCSTMITSRLTISRQRITMVEPPKGPSTLHHARARRACLAGFSDSAEALRIE